MREIFKKPYIYWFLAIFIFYIGLNILLSGFYKTIPLIIVYLETVNWVKLGISLVLTLVIGFLVSLNGVLVYIKYKERKKCKGVGTASAGTIGGLIVGVCPLCVTGIFPLILGLIGISFSLGSLPFQGIEIQVLVALILFASYKQLSK
ncbi:hypothetical protein COU53_01175 [Candidatus Pacearchaeota archaeon CG10_big_fil_rev_8_21_14_0_10_30_48]|nr:MAG: hypothetical protein COU53_01175 [Candidatus Pacearchaeota archaeon CG10_big_fil_rev_8_21_14_0_10_30_48]